MDAAAREREIERAWRQHEPERAKVPLEARRQAKAFRDRIAPDADKIKAAYQSQPLRDLLNDWARKSAVWRNRAIRKIKQALAPAAVDDAGGALIVAWLQAHERFVLVDSPTFGQSGIVISAAHISRAGRDIRESSFPVLEAPQHALARMFERSSSHIDAAQALHEAAACFLAADMRTVESARLRGATPMPARRRRAVLVLSRQGTRFRRRRKITDSVGVRSAARKAEGIPCFDGAA